MHYVNTFLYFSQMGDSVMFKWDSKNVMDSPFSHKKIMPNKVTNKDIIVNMINSSEKDYNFTNLAESTILN